MLERADIEWALHEIARRLDAAGLEVSISVVGGAAIVLDHNPDRGATNDIDTWIAAAPVTREEINRIIADIAVEKGIVDKSGAWYSYGKERIGQGRENTRIYLKERPEMCAEIREKLLVLLGLPGAAAIKE